MVIVTMDKIDRMDDERLLLHERNAHATTPGTDVLRLLTFDFRRLTLSYTNYSRTLL